METTNEFVNRKRELAFLSERYSDKRAQLIVLYGRRRVGKTELLLQFSKNKQGLYLLADLKTEREQMRDFSFKMAQELKDELLKVQPLDNAESFFTYIHQLSLKKRIVVVIDEFPYLCKVNSAFASILQKYWDMKLKHSNIFLVLCGSSIGMMEKETLLKDSPLYGRRTGDWLVSQLKFSEFLEFFPEIDTEKAIYLYSIVGGIPEYILKLNPNKSVEENILNIIKKGSPLYKEVEFCIKEELSEPHNYFAILKALAIGKNKQKEIIDYTGLDKGMVSKYLSVLEGLQIVKRNISITEKREKTRKSLYIVNDNYFRFWFRFCFPNKSLIEEGKEEYVVKNEILPKINQFTSQTFEEICKELIQKNYEKVGSWWSSKAEIDVIGVNKDEEVLYGECKFTKEKMNMEDLQKLINTSNETNLPAKTKKYALFSKNGFEEDLKTYAKTNKNIILFDLERIRKEIG